MRKGDEIHSAAWRRVRAEVMAREDNCYLCGRPVDKSLSGNAEWGPQVDHVEARAAGGEVFERSNLHLVHKHCNAQKSSMPVEVFMYRYREKRQNSRKWR